MLLYLQEVKMNKEDKKNQSGDPTAQKPQAHSDEKVPVPLGDKKSQSAAGKINSVENKKEVDKKPSSAEGEVSANKKPADPEKLPSKEEVKLSGLYAFKLAMSSIYDEEGRFVPVTFLEVKPWIVSQIKRKEKEGYNSVQVACMSQKYNRCTKALQGHLSSTGVSDGSSYIREIRQDSVDNIEVGQPVSIHSVQKGDKVKLQAISKGHGFAGVVKRWGFKGGPASHGAKTHRTGGSIGNRTEPARVMPGKKMSGHYGVEKVSLKNRQVMDVISDANLIVVKGSVPGARHSLVYIQKAGS